jgi:hypothetical protein
VTRALETTSPCPCLSPRAPSLPRSSEATHQPWNKQRHSNGAAIPLFPSPPSKHNKNLQNTPRVCLDCRSDAASQGLQRSFSPPQLFLLFLCSCSSTRALQLEFCISKLHTLAIVNSGNGASSGSFFLPQCLFSAVDKKKSICSENLSVEMRQSQTFLLVFARPRALAHVR